jgi:hypothetical protein
MSGPVNVTEPKPVQGDLAELSPKPLLIPFAAQSGGLGPNDVDQGKLKNCCLPAVLAAMANTETGRARIRAMTVFDKGTSALSQVNGKPVLTPGVVRVSFGTNNTVVVISRLLYREKMAPSEKGPGEILYAKNTSGQGWVSFIEKAYAIFLSNRKKAPEISYAILIMIDPKTVMQDLMGLRLAPSVVVPSKSRAATRTLLKQANTFPTVATTPKAPSGINTPHGALANHAYAIRGLKEVVEKGVKKSLVLLSSDEDEFPFDDFLLDFDTIVTVRRQ